MWAGKELKAWSQRSFSLPRLYPLCRVEFIARRPKRIMPTGPRIFWTSHACVLDLCIAPHSKMVLVGSQLNTHIRDRILEDEIVYLAKIYWSKGRFFKTNL